LVAYLLGPILKFGGTKRKIKEDLEGKNATYLKAFMLGEVGLSGRILHAYSQILSVSSKLKTFL